MRNHLHLAPARHFAVALGALLTLTSAAHAAPMTWTVDCPVLVDPFNSHATGRVSGTFVFDADTLTPTNRFPTLSNVDITLTSSGYSVYPADSQTFNAGYAFINVQSKFTVPFSVNYASSKGDPQLYFLLAAPLTNAGGIVQVTQGVVGRNDNTVDPLLTSTGTFTASVPEPTVLGALTIASSGLLIRRRQKITRK